MWRDVKLHVVVLLTHMLSRLWRDVPPDDHGYKKMREAGKMCCAVNIVFDAPLLCSALSFLWKEQTTLVFFFNLAN